MNNKLSLKSIPIPLFLIIVILFICTVFCSLGTAERTSPLIIDHTSINLSEIPNEWIDYAQEEIKWHYSHTSHGGQLTTGLQRIEDIDPTYSYVLSTSNLPTEVDALCIKDGMTPIRDVYNTPDDYFSSDWLRPYYVQDLLNLPEYEPITVSSFCFCTQMNSYSEATVNAYLQAMANLEEDNPEISFVYFTGNAQTGPGNHYNQDLDQGYNRYLRNEQIRNYCQVNNKILFDFADIDCWWYNITSEEWELATYEYWNGTSYVTVPFEHPHYNVNQAAHTSYENCENKGKAVWYLMAKLAGWNTTEGVIDINQHMFDRGFPIRHTWDGDWGAAQNFSPTLSVISQVDVYLRKFGTPEFDLTIELRENHPEGVLLDTIVFSADEVESSWMWLTVNCSDIPVASGTDYFIVLPPAPSGVSTSFGYEWGYAFGDQYQPGSFWFTRDGGGLWRDLPTMYDFTFRTYGIE